MAFLVATPSLILPTVPTETAQVVAFVAMAGMILTTMEYGSSSPCLFEFRDAGPFNRIRYGATLLTVVLVSLVARHEIAPNGLTAFVTAIGHVAGGLLDFPYSPLRIALPTDERPEAACAALGVTVLVFGGFFALFAAELHRGRWPSAGMFNVWVNLPTFDPTRGGDVVARLDRDGKFNVVLGCVLPVLFPLILGAEDGALGRLSEAQPQAMVWTVAFWIGLPFSLFMRGLAMQRIASMIASRRSDSAAPRAGLVPL